MRIWRVVYFVVIIIIIISVKESITHFDDDLTEKKEGKWGKIIFCLYLISSSIKNAAKFIRKKLNYYNEHPRDVNEKRKTTTKIKNLMNFEFERSTAICKSSRFHPVFAFRELESFEFMIYEQQGCISFNNCNNIQFVLLYCKRLHIYLFSICTHLQWSCAEEVLEMKSNKRAYNQANLNNITKKNRIHISFVS